MCLLDHRKWANINSEKNSSNQNKWAKTYWAKGYMGPGGATSDPDWSVDAMSCKSVTENSVTEARALAGRVGLGADR